MVIFHGYVSLPEGRLVKHVFLTTEKVVWSSKKSGRMVDSNGLLFSSEVNDTAIRAVAANKRRWAAVMGELRGCFFFLWRIMVIEWEYPLVI